MRNDEWWQQYTCDICGATAMLSGTGEDYEGVSIDDYVGWGLDYNDKGPRALCPKHAVLCIAPRTDVRRVRLLDVARVVWADAEVVSMDKGWCVLADSKASDGTPVRGPVFLVDFDDERAYNVALQALKSLCVLEREGK